MPLSKRQDLNLMWLPITPHAQNTNQNSTKGASKIAVLDHYGGGGIEPPRLLFTEV